MLLDPGPEILHLRPCLLDRRSVEAGIEHIVNRVAVDGLFALPVQLQNPAAEGRLQEGRDRISRKPLRRLIDLFLQRPHDTELLSRRFGLGIRVAGVEKAAGEVGKGIAARELLQLRELGGAEPALKPREPFDSNTKGNGRW